MASVYTRGKSLWLHYTVDGKLFRKPLKLKNTKQNMRLAINKCLEDRRDDTKIINFQLMRMFVLKE